MFIEIKISEIIKEAGLLLVMEYFDIVVLVLLPPLHTLKVFTACSLRGFAVVWSFAP